MNLPDDISKLRNVSEKKTAQEMYEEAIQKQKRNALARINSKKKPEDLCQ